MQFVRQQPCCARHLGPCKGRIDPHHAGWNHSAGEGRGTGIKASDDTCIPLCRYHHRCIERYQGPFAGWNRAIRRVWVDERIAEVRRRFDAWTNGPQFF